jgi:hypothetical protein
VIDGASNVRAAGRCRPLECGVERTRGARSRMEGCRGGSPGSERVPLRSPEVMFRLRCRCIRSQPLHSGAVRSVKGVASFSSKSKRKQRLNIPSRGRVIERRRRVPPGRAVEASFNVWSAPAPRQGRVGVFHFSFPNSFPEVFPTTNPVRASVGERVIACAVDVSRRAHADVRHRHAKRLQGLDNAISMFLALARPCSRARAVDVVSVRVRMRSSTLIRR